MTTTKCSTRIYLFTFNISSIKKVFVNAAISLEWDKLPHYLEASLMMKGYTAAEAREASLRSMRDPLTRDASRPPLAATAYATTRDKVCSLLPIPIYLFLIKLFESHRDL